MQVSCTLLCCTKDKMLLITFRQNRDKLHTRNNLFPLICLLSPGVSFSESSPFFFANNSSFLGVLPESICNDSSLSFVGSRSAAVLVKDILSRDVVSLLSVILKYIISLLPVPSD